MVHRSLFPAGFELVFLREAVGHSVDIAPLSFCPAEAHPSSTRQRETPPNQFSYLCSEHPNQIFLILFFLILTHTFDVYQIGDWKTIPYPQVIYQTTYSLGRRSSNSFNTPWKLNPDFPLGGWSPKCFSGRVQSPSFLLHSWKNNQEKNILPSF